MYRSPRRSDGERRALLTRFDVRGSIPRTRIPGIGLGLGGRSHEAYGELACARIDLAERREKNVHMGEPSRRWGVSHETDVWFNGGLFDQGTWQGQKELQHH